MAVTEDRRTSSAIEKAAIAEAGISDFLRDRRTFGIVASGFTVAKTEQLIDALLFDRLAGKLEINESALILKAIDTALKWEDQNIIRKQMVDRAEVRRDLKARREKAEGL